MSLINRNFLEQAQVAAQQQNWQRVNQYLQQVLEPNQAFATPPTAAEQTELELVVSLALDVLVGGDFSARWEVAKTFPKLGTAVTAPLIGILEDAEADWELRWFAARILGEFECPEVVTALVELLKTDEQEDLMGMAAEALASLGPLAVAALSELLAQESTRLLAVRSLSQIRRGEIISPLLTVVQDPQVLVRATAIEALGSFHNSDIPPVLVSALTDSAAIVRRAAVSGLSFRADLLEELDLVNQIQPLLWDFDWEVCAAAASALGRLGTDAAAEALFEVLESPNTPVSLQVGIVRALGWTNTAKALAYLQQALKLETLVCQEVVSVLGRIQPPHLTAQATQMLIDVLQSEHPAMQAPPVKQALALSLGQLGELKAINPLIELLSDPDAGVRLHAIAALKKLAPEAAHRQLEDLAQDEQLIPALKQGVAIALSEWSV